MRPGVPYGGRAGEEDASEEDASRRVVRVRAREGAASARRRLGAVDFDAAAGGARRRRRAGGAAVGHTTTLVDIANAAVDGPARPGGALTIGCSRVRLPPPQTWTPALAASISRPRYFGTDLPPRPLGAHSAPFGSSTSADAEISWPKPSPHRPRRTSPSKPVGSQGRCAAASASPAPPRPYAMPPGSRRTPGRSGIDTFASSAGRRNAAAAAAASAPRGNAKTPPPRPPFPPPPPQPTTTPVPEPSSPSSSPTPRRGAAGCG